MNTGDTLFIPEPGTSLDSHLWVIISDPIRDPDKVVLVSFTKYRPDKDQACVLEVGDHSFITQKTCVEYRRCKIVTESQLDALVRLPYVEVREPVSTHVLQRILDGVPDSRMPLNVAQLLADQGLTSI